MKKTILLKYRTSFFIFTAIVLVSTGFIFGLLGEKNKVLAALSCQDPGAPITCDACTNLGCTFDAPDYTQCGGDAHPACEAAPSFVYPAVEVHVDRFSCADGFHYLTYKTGNPCGPPQTPAPCDPNSPTFGPCPGAVPQLEKVFTNFLSVSVGIALIILVVMLTISGIKFLTSGGEPKAILFAQQTATWAIVGVVLLAVAWLVLWLIYATTGIPVHKFCIGLPPVTVNCP